MHPCGKCGNVNSTDSIFCGHCGNRLNNKCPACAFDNLPAQKFCGNCGKQLQADTELPGSALRYGQAASGTAAVAESAAPPVSSHTEARTATEITSPDYGTPASVTHPAPAKVAAASPVSETSQVEAAPPPAQTYALASIEIANWEQLKARALDADQMDVDRQEVLNRVAHLVLAAGGQINASKNGVLFIAFTHEPTLRASVEKAVQVSLDLLGMEFQVGFHGVRLKIGMDIENPQARDPLVSTLERSIGLSGTLTVSETTYREIQGVYPAEMIGPIPMGNRTLNFYRLMKGETIPELAQFLPRTETISEAPPRIIGRASPEPATVSDGNGAASTEAEDLARAVRMESGHSDIPLEDRIPQADPTGIDYGVPRPRQAVEAPTPQPEEISIATPDVSEMRVEEIVPPAPRQEIPPSVEEPLHEWLGKPAAPEEGLSEDSAAASGEVLVQNELYEIPVPVEEAQAESGPPDMTAVMPEAPVETGQAEAAEAEPLHAEAAMAAGKEAVSETPAETETEPEAPVQGAWADGEMPPGPPHYEAPALGLRKTTRPANLSYEQAIEALTTELGGFLSEGLEARGRVLSLCGTDGLGKSNIINMVRARVDVEGQRAIWMGGHNYRCFHRNELPMYYWLEMMQNMLSLVFEGQAAGDVREQVSRFLAFIHEGEVPPEDMAFLTDFLSVHPPQPLSVESREHLGRAENFFFEFFTDLASKRPVILVVEDITFADNASLDILNRMLEKGILDRPVCIILTQSRDYYAAGRFAACLQKVPHKEMVVSDLEDAESERFLNDGPLGGKLHEFPTPLIELLLQYAAGAPIYLEEALRWLHLKEILTVDETTHKFVINKAFDPAEVDLPGDVSQLIRMRLEFLNEKALFVLRLASVLGEKFAVGVLMALSQLQEDEFNQALTTLFNHGYLLPDVVNTGRFRHGLIWQAIYDDMPQDLRMEMHQLVSETLENDFNQSLTINPMLIAYHAENGQLPNRALNYWNLAGIYSAQVGSLTAMNMAMFRAMDLLRESTKEPLHTQELALRIIENVGLFNLQQNPDLAIDSLEWVFHYRQLAGDGARLIEPLGFLASAYETKGDYVKALGTLDRALEHIDSKAYPMETASLLINKLEHLYTLGRMQAALRLMEDAIEPIAANIGTDNGNPETDADFFDAYLQARLIKAQVMLAQCDPKTMQLLDETMHFARERGLEGLMVALQLVRGQVLLRNGQYETCNQEADGMLSAIEAMEDSDWFLAQWGLLALMYHCAVEDWESASQLILTVMSKSEETHDYLTWMTAQAYAGHIAARMGKTQEAQQMLEKTVELASEHHFASAALISWRFLAELEQANGQSELSHEIAARALEIASKPEILNQYEKAQLSLTAARALMSQGKLKPAGKLLEPLWPLAVQSRSQPLIAACAFEVAQLYKHLGQEATGEAARKHLMRSVEFFLKAKGIWLELRHLANVKRVDAAIPQL